MLFLEALLLLEKLSAVKIRTDCRLGALHVFKKGPINQHCQVHNSRESKLEAFISQKSLVIHARVSGTKVKTEGVFGVLFLC